MPFPRCFTRGVVPTLCCMSFAVGAAGQQNGSTVEERLRRLEQDLARERAANERARAEERAKAAAGEAVVRALQDRLDQPAGRGDQGGAERGGAPGGVDDDRVRKVVREMLADKKTTDDLRKSFGTIEAGFRKPVDYQGSAFFIKSGEDFQLNIQGRMQLRYYFADQNPSNRRDGIPLPPRTGPPPPAGPNNNPLNNNDIRSDFAIGRFRPGFSGHLYNKSITYNMEMVASTRANDAVSMFQAFVNWDVFGENKDVPIEYRNAVQLRFGQFFTPWGRWETIGDFQPQIAAALQTIDHSPPTAFFMPDRNVGLEVHGIVGGVREGLPDDRPGTRGWYEYHFAVTNGWQSAGRRYGYEGDTGAGNFNAANARQNDYLPALTVRQVVDILKGRFTGQDGKDYYIFGRNQSDLEHHETPALQVGVSGAWWRSRGQDRPVNNPALGAFYRPPTATTIPDQGFADVFNLGADAGFKWRGLSLQGEMYYQKINARANGAGVLNQTQDQDIFGYYIQGGYFICPHTLEVYYQFSGVQAGTTPSGPAFPLATNPLAGTNSPFNHNHVFGMNWYPFQSQNIKLTLEGAVLVNNPVPSAQAGWVSSSREDIFQGRLQVQVAF